MYPIISLALFVFNIFKKFLIFPTIRWTSSFVSQTLEVFFVYFTYSPCITSLQNHTKNKPSTDFSLLSIFFLLWIEHLAWFFLLVIFLLLRLSSLFYIWHICTLAQSSIIRVWFSSLQLQTRISVFCSIYLYIIFIFHCLVH